MLLKALFMYLFILQFFSKQGPPSTPCFRPFFENICRPRARYALSWTWTRPARARVSARDFIVRETKRS